jgi:hypothetical protein
MSWAPVGGVAPFGVLGRPLGSSTGGGDGRGAPSANGGAAGSSVARETAAECGWAPLVGLSVDATLLGLGSEGEAHPLMRLTTPPVGLEACSLGPSMSGDMGVEELLVGPGTCSTRQAQPEGAKWLWLVKGCTVPSLGFPARISEVRRRKKWARKLFKILEPPPLTRYLQRW